MKVTSRELTLLVALLAVAFIYLLYTFLFNPLLGNVSVAREAFSAAKDKQIQVEENNANLANVIKQQKALAVKTDELVAKFLPSVKEDIIVTFFSTTVSKGGAGIDGLYFDDLAAVNLDSLAASPNEGVIYPYGNMAARARGYEIPALPGDPTAETKEQNNTTVLSQGIAVGFVNSSYDQIVNQMKAVEAVKRTIVVDTISIEKGDTGNLEGYVHYNFYGVDKLTEKDKGLPETLLTDPNGKANPFI